MVKLTIKATTHGGVTPAMQELAEKKFDFLDGRVANDSDARLTVSQEGQNISVTVAVITLDHHRISMEHRGRDFYTIIPQLASSLKETISQYDDKRHTSYQLAGDEPEDADCSVPPDLDDFRVVIASEMNEGDAIAEAEREGHRWYAFRDIELVDTPIAIVYKRADNSWATAVIR